MTVLSGSGELRIDGVSRGNLEYKISENSGRGQLYGLSEVMLDAWSSQDVTLTLAGEDEPTEIIVASYNGGGQAEMTFKTTPRR